MSEYDTQRLGGGDNRGHALIQELLPLYLEGEVSPESHALIADHLLRCERCSGFLQGMEATRARRRKAQARERSSPPPAPAPAPPPWPAAGTPGHLWRTLLGATWLGGLVLTFATTVASVPAGILLGALLVVAAIGGHIWLKLSRGMLWYAGMLAMWPLGLLMIAHPQYDHFNGVPQTGLSMPLGVVFLVVATWGLWPHRGSQPAQP